MGGYKFLEHTADVLFEAEGKDLREAVEAAASAMFSVIANGGKVGTKASFTIVEEAPNLEELVVFTLSRLLSESETREIALAKFEVRKLARGKSFSLEGKAYGEKGKRPKVCVKAVTHHEARVEESPAGVKIRILLDV
ncbi:MAG: archease [Candidatus Micrarchaeota archaeon]|nr:archease [Candidatus Micrarchaeota archaeon]